jgi:hypothetical protein
MSHKLLTLLLTLTLAAAAVPALAQAPAVPPAIADALVKEAPLSQADIDIYLQKMPEAPNFMKSQEDMVKFAKSTGLTESRYFYVFSKIPLAMSLAAGVPAEALGLNQMPEALRPTEADLALIKTNAEALQKVMMELATAMEAKSAEAKQAESGSPAGEEKAAGEKKPAGDEKPAEGEAGKK